MKRSDWITTPLGICTRIKPGTKHDFQDYAKLFDLFKKSYNKKNCAMAMDLKTFFNTIVSDVKFRCLVIDALYLSSSSALFEEAGILLKDMDIVSKTIEFKPPPKGGRCGQLHTGDLYEFLLDLPIPDSEEERYDVVVLDFCGAGSKNLNCFDILCEKLLIADAAVGSITLSARGGRKLEYMKQEKLEAQNYMITKAMENGYSIRFYGELEYQQMFSLFFKMIHNFGSLHPQGGFKTKDKDASNWLNTPFKF
ncbi:MAG: hypothetical protein K2Q45_06715 [Nitrosomonas sp.]|nr:hypothetical protein [Nitrosomonas sp.]